MASIIYLMCAATALACTILLLRSYHRSRHRLLLWSALCFAGMSLNNLLSVLDRIILPERDLSTWRLAEALVVVLPLLYGLVWEDE